MVEGFTKSSTLMGRGGGLKNKICISVERVIKS